MFQPVLSVRHPIPSTLARVLVSLACLTPAFLAQNWVDTARRYVRDESGEFQYLADLDLDGDDDVVWFRESNDRWREFQAYLNDGTGELVPVGSPVAFPDNGSRFVPVSVQRLEDVTGDGWPDLLVAELPSAGSTTLHVYPGKPGGTFDAPIPIVGPSTAVALGNVDLDPALELGVAETSGVAWYDWDGASFSRSATSPLGGSPLTGMIAFDLEGDGDDDLLHGLSSGRSLILYRTSHGAPGPAISVALPVRGPSELVAHVSDLDGVGQLDVLVAARKLRNGAVSLIPVWNAGGGLVPGSAQPLSNSGIPRDVTGFRFGDWDGDGDTDALYYPWTFSVFDLGGAGRIAFFENGGASGFDPAPAAEAVTNDEVSYGQPGGRLVGTVDLDRDGRLDVVGPTSVLFGRGRLESSLVPIPLFPNIFNHPLPPRLLDFDEDGDLDAFLDNGRVLLNDGTGAFAQVVFPPGPPPEREHGILAGIGDFSADGRIDLLMQIYIPPPSSFENSVFEEIRLYTADGLGGFLDAGRVSSTPLGGLTDDLDRDGDLDLIGIRGHGGYWPNIGGDFAPFVPLFGQQEIPAALADLDSDGDSEVVTKAIQAGRVVVWRNLAPPRKVRKVAGMEPRFAATTVLSTTDSLSSTKINLADHDADGDLDLAVSLRLFVNDGAGNFSPGAVLATGFHGHAHLVFEDIDADGRVDLFAGSEGEPRANLLVSRGLGGGLFGAPRTYAGSAMGPPGDLDGDGDLDLSGRAVVRSLRFDGPRRGRIRQYGAGTPGSGGATPVLGATGPLRIGASGAGIRLRRGLGAARFALFFSFSVGTGPSVPYPGAPTLLGPPIHFDVYTALGVPGQAGAGRFDLDLGPELASLAGLTLYFQAGVVDPEAADGFALTNGLELTFGF